MPPTRPTSAAIESGLQVRNQCARYCHQLPPSAFGAQYRGRAQASDGLRRTASRRGSGLHQGRLSFLRWQIRPPDPRAYFHREYVETGVLDPKELAGGMHCMSPAYLENQIERSRRNLGLETIDLFYIHNPESQLADVSREVFRQRLKDAFAALEKLAKAGKTPVLRSCDLERFPRGRQLARLHGSVRPGEDRR